MTLAIEKYEEILNSRFYSVEIFLDALSDICLTAINVVYMILLDKINYIQTFWIGLWDNI